MAKFTKIKINKNVKNGNLLTELDLGETGFKPNSKFVLDEMHKACLIYNGEVADAFESGKYKLSEKSAPIYHTLKKISMKDKTPNTKIYIVRKKMESALFTEKVSVSNSSDKLNLCIDFCFEYEICDVQIFMREQLYSDIKMSNQKIEEFIRRLLINSFERCLTMSGLKQTHLKKDSTLMDANTAMLANESLVKKGLAVVKFKTKNMLFM